MVGTEGDAGEEPGTPWYRSSSAVVLLGVDVLVLAAAAAGTTLLVSDAAPGWLSSGHDFSVPVPWEVYAFSVLGAFGYVFTAFVVDFDRTPADVLEYQFHVVAAIPLGAGVYLLAALLLGTGTDGTVAVNDRLVAGLAFIAGLYVKLTYRRIGAAAERLLPEESSRKERTGRTDEPEG
jgi:hypothetical protein